MKEKEQGSITVFVSLLMIVFLAVTLLFQEIMRIYLGYGRIAVSMDGAGQHILADYNQALAEQYNLYALDETYNGYGVEELLSRVQDYLEYHLNPEMLLGKTSGFYGIQVKDIHIDEQLYLTEKDNENLKKQIQDYVKLFQIQEGIDFLTQQIPGLKESKEQSDSMKKELKKKAREEELGKQQSMEPGTTGPDYQESETSAPKVEDPRDGLNSILSKGILYYITDGDQELGNETTLEAAEPQSFLSLDGLMELMQKEVSTELSGSIKEKAELSCYLLQHFSNYCNNPNDYEKVNRCEMEYILCGKSSDADNLNKMAGKIIALRFPMNYAVAMGDSTMRQEALTVATALVGVTGIAPVVTAVQYLLLGAWAYGETLVEMKGLLQNKSVALVKNSTQWNLSLSNLGSEAVSCKNIEEGISYEGYLTLFLAITSKEAVIDRMYKVIETNLQLNNPDFQIKHCVSKFQLTGRHVIEAREQMMWVVPTNWYQYEISVIHQY